MAETRESEGTARVEAPAEQQTSQDRPQTQRPPARRGGGGQRSSGPRGRGGFSRGGRRYRGRPKVCYFCTNKDAEINYKGVDTLRRFVTDRGKIRPRRQTGTCARHQRRLSTAIKRARHLALLPFTAEYKE